MALRNLMVRVGANITGLSAGLKQAQKDVKYFGRNVTGSLKEMQGKMAGVASVLGGGFLLKSGIQDAMRYEALMATIGESLGSSRKDFEKWQTTVGRSLGYSRLQSAETASLMSLNFKKIAVDQQDLMQKTTKMMEIAAVISNKRGMTMQETSDRIRSALNGEADGADELGVNVRISAMKQSEAYKQMADGQPWDQLSDKQQVAIRYQHILNEVTANLGATIQDTTSMRMAVFTASLADVKLALGQAFLPILHTVLPVLTALANGLIKVLQVIGGFMRALFGGFKFKAPVSKSDVKATNAQAKALDGVGNSADKAGKKSEKAGKKAKKAWSGTFGFDEVHTIKDPEPTADAGAGAGGGGGGGGLGDLGGGMPLDLGNPFEAFNEGMEELGNKFKKYVEPIKEVAKQIWEAISTFAVEKFNQISAWWQENGTQIIQAMKNVWNFILPIITFVIKFIWESVKGLISGVITFFQGLIEFFTGVFTGDWQMAWEGLKKIFIGAFQAVWNFFNLTLVGGMKKLLLSFFKGGITKITEFGKGFIKIFDTTFKDIVKGFLNFIKSLKDFFTNFGKWMWDTGLDIAHKVISAFEKIGAVGKTIWTAIKNAFFGAVDWFVRTIITPVINKFNEIKNAFKVSIKEGLKAVLNSVRGVLNDMIGGLNAVKNKIPGANLLPNIPKIPAFAKGGITSGPMLAMVGDNPGGREVIAPLDRLESMLTNAVIQAMQLGNTGGGGHSGDIILNIDGRSFARVVKPFLDREQNRVGNDVRIRTI